MDIHLYMLCYRTEALVASQLSPEAFGLYMAMGTQKNTRGNVLFFEIDPKLKSDYFRLHDLGERCVAHPDGRPKSSKYISIYRVLEHLPLSSFGKLYLTTADGRTLALDPTPYDSNSVSEITKPHLYDELCPVTPTVVSTLPPPAFVKFMTDPNNPVSVPRIFLADMLLDRDESGRLAGYLPYPDPMHVVDCIKEVERSTTKPTKTLSRTWHLHGFFRTIGRGFYVGDQTGMKFYGFPELRVLEIQHSKWWRSASESLIS